MRAGDTMADQSARRVELDALAYRLKEEGRTYDQVGAEMGVSGWMARTRIRRHRFLLRRLEWRAARAALSSHGEEKKGEGE